jgi:hypothetical protein
MKKSILGIIGRVALCCLAAGILASCATSKGSTLRTVIAAEKGNGGREQPAKPPDHPPPEATRGLQVVTDPDSAEVWIDGAFMGLSPYAAETIEQGWHRLNIRKQGYYELTAWVEFKGTAMVYQASLEQITGFLQVSVTPEGGRITVNGDELPAGIVELPVGNYDLRVRLFGYADYQSSVTVADKSVSAVSVELQPAPFSVTSFGVTKAAVNPDSPGLLGIFEGTISVTGPGSGELRIMDATGKEVYRRALPEFSTWDQGFTWDGRDTAGAPLPDGTYAVSLLAQGPGNDAAQTRDLSVKVDRTLKVAARSMWSGSSGLLYAPVSEVLPPGDFQISVLGAGVYDPLSGDFQAPVQFGARVGLPGGLEIDASAGVIATSVSTPFMANVAVRWSLLSPHGAYGTGYAIQVKLAGQLLPTADSVEPLMTDTFSNFTGISVEIPFQLQLGQLGFLLSAGAIGSLWYPFLPYQGPMAWLYLRGGVMLETGSLTAGISASTRTQPLPNGYALLGSPVPFALGAEIHWLIPGTRLVLWGILAGEADDEANNYFMGGGGLGFLY